MEYCDGGTLADAAARGAFKQRIKGGYGASVHDMGALYLTLLEIASALRHLHALRLVHCDVKAGNVLIRSNARDPRGFTTKLSDFGLVTMVEEDDQGNLVLRPSSSGRMPSKAQVDLPDLAQLAALDAARGGEVGADAGAAADAGAMQAQGGQAGNGRDKRRAVGTPTHMAPEVIRGSVAGAALDIWSFGVLMAEIIGDQPVYLGLRTEEILARVAAGSLKPELPPWAPQDLRALAETCWATAPDARPTAAQLVQRIKAAMSERGMLSAPRRQRSKVGLAGNVPGSPVGRGGAFTSGLATSPNQRSSQPDLSRATSAHLCGLEEFAIPVQQFPSVHPPAHRPYGGMDWSQLVSTGAGTASQSGTNGRQGEESEMDTFPLHIL